MYQNYIFDLYGTLVDIKTNEAKKSFWEKTAFFYSLNGAMYNWKELRRRYSELIAKEEQVLWKKQKQHVPERTVAEVEISLERVFAKLYREKGISASKQLIADTCLTFRTLSMERLTLFEGARETLEGLREKGKKVYLLTNAQYYFTEPELRVLGIKDCFDGILFSSSEGIKKPSKDFFDLVFKRYGLQKEESVMVGNDRFSDVQGALDYGMECRYLHTEQSTPFEGELPKGCIRISRLPDLLSE
ncbi:MAG: HAD family hydrolase [Lachnospiraceae bacterium]